jgi:hypothetical protein
MFTKFEETTITFRGVNTQNTDTGFWAWRRELNLAIEAARWEESRGYMGETSGLNGGWLI